MKKTAMYLPQILLKISLVVSIVLFLVAFPGCKDDEPAPPPPPKPTGFVKFYSGMGASSGKGITETATGGFVMVGTTQLANNPDMWILEVDKDGAEKWSHQIDGSGRDDFGLAVRVTNDGYLFTGSTADSAGFFDIMVVKTDLEGNIMFQKSYGTTPGEHEEGGDIQPTTDGGFVIVGTTTKVNDTKALHNPLTDFSDIFVVRAESDGSVRWEITNGFEDLDTGVGIEALSDGSFILVAATARQTLNGGNLESILLQKVDADGNWTDGNLFAVEDPERVTAKSLSLAENGDYLVSGVTEGKIYLTRISQGLIPDWEVTQPTFGELVALDMVEANGKLIIAGYHKPVSSNTTDLYVAIAINQGSIQQEVFSSDNGNGEAAGLVALKDGGFAVIGTQNDATNVPGIVLIKSDLEGNLPDGL